MGSTGVVGQSRLHEALPSKLETKKGLCGLGSETEREDLVGREWGVPSRLPLPRRSWDGTPEQRNPSTTLVFCLLRQSFYELICHRRGGRGSLALGSTDPSGSLLPKVVRCISTGPLLKYTCERTGDGGFKTILEVHPSRPLWNFFDNPVKLETVGNRDGRNLNPGNVP